MGRRLRLYFLWGGSPQGATQVPPRDDENLQGGVSWKLKSLSVGGSRLGLCSWSTDTSVTSFILMCYGVCDTPVREKHVFTTPCLCRQLSRVQDTLCHKVPTHLDPKPRHRRHRMRLCA